LGLGNDLEPVGEFHTENQFWPQQPALEIACSRVQVFSEAQRNSKEAPCSLLDSGRANGEQ